MSSTKETAREKFEREIFIEKLRGEYLDVWDAAYDAGYESARDQWTAEMLKMAKALDAIYNHNEATRAAVIQYYGLHHGEVVRELRQQGGE